MSAARIDHVAQAIELDEVAAQHLVTDEFAYADMALKAAQVHATLALVEQKRIANLVALADHAHARWGNYAGEAGGMGTLFSYGETETDNMRIRDDIREALGLS